MCAYILFIQLIFRPTVVKTRPSIARLILHVGVASSRHVGHVGLGALTLCWCLRQGSHLLQPPGPAPVPLLHLALRETADRSGGNQHVWPGMRKSCTHLRSAAPLMLTPELHESTRNKQIQSFILRDVWPVRAFLL